MKMVEIREHYHKMLCKELIRVHRNSQKGDYPNNADGDSRISVKIAWGILNRICPNPINGSLSGQTAGKKFENITRYFVKEAFGILKHLRPGRWSYFVETEISKFEQYLDLAEVEAKLKKDRKLAATFGWDYIIKPDIVVSRESVTDDEINEIEELVNAKAGIATLTPFRSANSERPKHFLHACISCKWTLRSDRAQNIRTEALNLVRNRKGKQPHIVAVTAEPTLTRIASLALGTGDIDCVYHFALNELIDALQEIQDESQLEMLDILISGKRLRDISDLPFDLAV